MVDGANGWFRGRYLLLNTLVEGRRGLEVRLQATHRSRGSRGRAKLRGWEEALGDFKGERAKWIVLEQHEAFKLNGSPPGATSSLPGGSDEELARLQFPRCRCAFVLPAELTKKYGEEEWGRLVDLLKNVIYNECNSVSEIYNRITLFVVPFMDEEVHARVMNENELKQEERGLKVTMIIGLEFEDEGGLEFEDASATMILSPESGEGPLGFAMQRYGSLEELRRGMTDAFHMRKNLLRDSDYERLRGLIRESLGEVSGKFGGLGMDERNREGEGRNDLHDLHDLQIYGILAAFRAFLGLMDADMCHIYESMRDDLRSNAFTSVLLELGFQPPDYFVVSLLEGFQVNLGEAGERVLERYRVGYKARNRNFYLSWNNLLMLDVREDVDGVSPRTDDDAWSFPNFALPRAIVLNTLAGELMYINSTYSELLSQMRSGGYELDSEIGKIAREMYVETALMFDLGYVQTPLLRKILESIVQQYGFRYTLEGLRSTLEALDASTSAEAAEGLNVVILIVGIVTVFATSSIWEQWMWRGVLLVLLVLLVLSAYAFRDAVKSIYWNRSLGRIWRRLRSRGRRAGCVRDSAEPPGGGGGMKSRKSDVTGSARAN